MHEVFGIGDGRSKDVRIYICGAVGTISAATRKTVAEGGEVGKD